jgi:hypothetical protein
MQGVAESRVHVGFSHHSRRRKPHAKTQRRKEAHGDSLSIAQYFPFLGVLGFLNPRQRVGVRTIFFPELEE